MPDDAWSHEEPDPNVIVPEDWFDPQDRKLKSRILLGAVSNAHLHLTERRHRDRRGADGETLGWLLHMSYPRGKFEQVKISESFWLLMQVCRSLSAILADRRVSTEYLAIEEGFTTEGDENCFVCTLAPGIYQIEHIGGFDHLFQVEETEG
jgi:hypothetical protein